MNKLVLSLAVVLGLASCSKEVFDSKEVVMSNVVMGNDDFPLDVVVKEDSLPELSVQSDAVSSIDDGWYNDDWVDVGQHIGGMVDWRNMFLFQEYDDSSYLTLDGFRYRCTPDFNSHMFINSWSGDTSYWVSNKHYISDLSQTDSNVVTMLDIIARVDANDSLLFIKAYLRTTKYDTTAIYTNNVIDLPHWHHIDAVLAKEYPMPLSNVMNFSLDPQTNRMSLDVLPNVFACGGGGYSFSAQQYWKRNPMMIGVSI